MRVFQGFAVIAGLFGGLLLPHSCFADRLGELISLSAEERSALTALEQRERAVRRGALLLREGDASGEMFVVRSGMLMSHMLLDNGSRQILHILLPGDLIAFASLAFTRSPESIVALSNSVVCPFDRTAMAGLAATHPRLAVAILAIQQAERVGMTDRVASLGRTAAKARVAAMLLDLRNRMHRDRADADFAVGMTQEEIGDATGLTAVHVNRMMRQLSDEGLIERHNGRVRILDDARLARAANYVNRYARLDLSWLPPSAA